MITSGVTCREAVFPFPCSLLTLYTKDYSGTDGMLSSSGRCRSFLLQPVLSLQHPTLDPAGLRLSRKELNFSAEPFVEDFWADTYSDHSLSVVCQCGKGCLHLLQVEPLELGLKKAGSRKQEVVAGTCIA